MEWKLWEGDPPEYTTPEWYAQRDRAAHLEEEGHRPRLELAAAMVREAALIGAFDSVVDLGAGDGGLLSLLADDGLRCWGYDLQPSNVAAAGERGVDVRLSNVLTDWTIWAPIAVATEMLEHLIDPHGFVWRCSEMARVLVASSPWSERPGAAYEFHTFAWDMDGYRALLEGAGWRVARHEAVGMFQVIMGVRS